MSGTGERPNKSWKRLTVEELKRFYESDLKKYSRMKTDIVAALVHLVEKGEVAAFMKPDGQIAYQISGLGIFMRS